MNSTNLSKVPFIADWSKHEVFGDLGEISKVDNPEKMLEAWRSQPTSSDDFGAERQVGVWSTVQANLVEMLARYSRSVARIVIPPGEHTDFLGETSYSDWKGTGFLVAPNLLLTNFHVLNSPEVAAKAYAEFNYQVTADDLRDGPPDDNTPSSTRFYLNPDRLFITGNSVQDLDYTFVWIDDKASEAFGHLPLYRGSFTIKKKEPTFVIHHPNGEPKQFSLDDTELLGIGSSAIVYAADTKVGSSGAPVFCPRGQLIALHHAWQSVRAVKAKYPKLTGQMTDGSRTNVVNEGIKLSAIALDLEARAYGGGDDSDAAQTVLSVFSGSDTATGLFGGLGRGSSESSENAYERVVDVYRGTGEDLDIGAWNIEWLANRWQQPEKLRRVATVITDLNLDIWALTEVSPNAVKALVKTLKTEFKQEYAYALSEPDAPDGRQTTAVIWRPKIVHGVEEKWPPEIEHLIRSNSRDDLNIEAVHGKIFNRYPALFHFTRATNGDAFDFYLVPLHLKAKEEGSLRRKLASKVLAYAVNRMIRHHNADKDWILLGDFNAPLASNDFANLTDDGFVPMSAEDEANGAITYIKSPYASLIDNIFLSENMSDFANPDNFFIVARDKVVDRFVRDISDHRPIAMRLSFTGGTERQSGQHRNIDTEFERILQRAGLSTPHPEMPVSKHTESRISWQYQGLNKDQFLDQNRSKILELISDVRLDLEAQYGPRARAVSVIDFWVLFYTEAGLAAGGVVDPTFVHSEGEHGILPLPSNIRSFWVGDDAPHWNRPMSIEDNIYYFALYLGQLKNKHAATRGGRSLYPSLFQEPGIDGHEEITAKLLAGVVHGYFYSGNYRRVGGRVPFDDILDGYRRDDDLDVIMRPTGYVHAGKSLMKNRQINIDTVLGLILSRRGKI